MACAGCRGEYYDNAEPATVIDDEVDVLGTVRVPKDHVVLLIHLTETKTNVVLKGCHLNSL